MSELTSASLRWALQAQAHIIADEKQSPLLLSQVQPPRLPAGLIARPRLFARLETWRSYKLTLLQAPAGFGKTTLVNSWLAAYCQQGASNLRIVWVALEANDNSPLHFWRTVISACQQWLEAPGKTALVPLQAALQPPFAAVPLETILTHFLNDLTQLGQEVILVLDNYHVISETRVAETCAFFIEHLPQKLHVMISTRNEPLLPLARWRSQAFMQELSPADLRFSEAETATFLANTLGALVPEQTRVRIDELLQGWPAGLRLLALAGKTRSEGIEQYLARFDVSRRSDFLYRQLLTYFVNEVLVTQPEPIQLFLRQTSVLPRLTGPLCDAVLDREESGALLEMLERAGLFLEALDEAEPWYRYYSLFAGAMHVEASKQPGEKVLRTLSARASLWYEQHDLFEDAISTALYAQDLERAGNLIERAGASGLRFDLSVLRRWLEQIPEEVLYAHPALCLYYASVLFFQTDPFQPSSKLHVETLLQYAEDAWQRAEQAPGLGLISALRALTASLQGELKNASGHAIKALELLPGKSADYKVQSLPEVQEWRIICLGIVASGTLYEGRFEEAQRLLREALLLAQKSSGQQFLGEISLRLGTVCLEMGELHQADAYYQQALAVSQADGNNEESIRALLGLAQVSIERYCLATVEQRIQEATELARRDGRDTDERVAYLLTLLYWTRGEDSAALEQLAPLIARLQAAPRPETTDVLFEALVLQARVQLHRKDPGSAQQTLERLMALIEEPSFVQRMQLEILESRLQCMCGKVEEALAQLQQLYTIVNDKKYVRGTLEILLLLVQSGIVQKKPQEGIKYIQKALAVSAMGGIVSVFLSEKDRYFIAVFQLALHRLREKTLLEHGYRIQRALNTPEEKLSQPQSKSYDNLPLEPLSAQEKRVLRLLAHGHSNKQIALELVITANTVKDHVKHIYRKLNVNSRLEVYQAAQRLNLLS